VTAGADGKPVGRRVIRTKPNVNYEAGDRTGRLPELIDLDFGKFVEAFASPHAALQPAPSAPAVTPAAPPPAAVPPKPRVPAAGAR